MRLDVGEVLPVTSTRSSEMRQAATPTHTVSIKDVTRRNIKENWLNSFSTNHDSKRRQRARFAESENAGRLT